MPFEFNSQPQYPTPNVATPLPANAVSYKVDLVANTVNVGGSLSYNTNVALYNVVYPQNAQTIFINIQVNSAFNIANSAYAHANGAFDYANAHSTNTAANGVIQYNANGFFGGDPNLIWDDANSDLLVIGNVRFTEALYAGGSTGPSGHVLTTNTTHAFWYETIDAYARPHSNGAFDHANSAYIHANSAYDYANSIGAAGASFGVVYVAGQANVVADTSNDLLTLIAGTGITLTTDATNDTVTITATGGSTTDQYARDTANGAFAHANGAFAHANGAFTQANGAIYTAAQIRANITNTAPINYDATTGTISHADSGATATTYGNSTFVSQVTVSATGHVTSASNVAIDTSLAQGAYNQANANYGIAQYAANNSNTLTQFIYSDVAANGVYTSWSTLYTAYQAAGSPPAEIGFLHINAGTNQYLYIPNGTYAFGRGSRFVGLANGSAVITSIRANSGVTISGIYEYRNLNLVGDSANTVIHTLDSTTDYWVTLRNSQVDIATGRFPWFSTANNDPDGSLLQLQEVSAIVKANAIRVGTSAGGPGGGCNLLLDVFQEAVLTANCIFALDANGFVTIVRSDAGTAVIPPLTTFENMAPGGVTTYVFPEKTGATADRPLYLDDGSVYFDTDLGVPIFRGSSAWLRLTTDEIPETTTNLYLTAARVRANVSNTAPINYNSTTGVFSHADSGVTATGYGSASQVPVFVVNATGHITSVTNTSIAIDASAITSGTLAVARGGTGQSSYTNGQILVGNAISTGLDVTTIAQTAPVIVTNGKGTITLSHASSGVTATGYGTATQIPVFVVDATGHVTSVTNTAIAGLAASVITSGTLAVAVGGTGQSAYTNGQILIGNTGSTGLDKSTIAQSAPVIVTVAQGSITLSHARSGVVSAVHGSASQVPVFDVDANGHITSVTNTSIAISAAAITSGTLAVARGGTGQTAITVNGSLLIGNTVSGGFDVNAITAGTNMTVSNDKGSITLSSSDAFAQAQANAAFNQANAAYANANTAIYTAAQIRANITNTAPINYDSSTGTVSHADSGVTATTYGYANGIPQITVNATGHITTASNVESTMSATIHQQTMSRISLGF